MYGLPPDFDPTIIVGRRLQQVSFTANTVHLSFDEDLSITLESTFEHRFGSDSVQLEMGSIPVAESRLMQLIDKSIKSAQIEDSGTLLLDFGDRHTLRCVDDSLQYESYRIKYGDREIVV